MGGGAGSGINGMTGQPVGIERHVLQMIAFASLDVVEDGMVGNGSM